jgi:23S rRNA pseudouridine2605 synthase
VRLAKYIAHAGVASRRAAERLVFDGRVTVDGRTVTDPARDVDDANAITVDGERVATERTLVYAVNKPLGVISTADDPEGRRTVVDLVGSDRRLYPVGRLDANSRGLMLVTNDGELANRLSHPRYGVPKTYRVRVRRGSPLSRDELDQLSRGVELEDGRTARAEVRKTGQREFEIVIREGRNRQIRRMCEAIGRDVGELQRVKFGPLELGRLKEGTVRRLSSEEVELLWQNVARPEASSRDRKRGPGGQVPMSDSNNRLFALRGATTVASDDADQIVEATEELLVEALRRNDLAPAALVSCIFTTTDDLSAQFPAVAARNIGLNAVPLLCAREIDVPGALPRAIRILLHYYAPEGHEARHVYLRDAVTLRTDLTAAQ